jgi:putative ABC transport system permease protein
MDTFIQDIRYGLRILRKSPAFTMVAVFTLALGIGANTAIFSLINAVLLKMLPVKDPAQLVVIGDPIAVHSTSMGSPQVDYFSYPLYRELSRGNNVFSGMLGSSEIHRLRVTGAKGDEISRNVVGVLVSGNYFSVLGVDAMLGRTITPEDDSAPGAHPVAVISYGFWKEKFGQDPGIVGQTVRLGNYPFTIVGVAPAGFFGDTVGDNQDIWMPITMQQQVMPGREWLDNLNVSWIHCLARRKRGSRWNRRKPISTLCFSSCLPARSDQNLNPVMLRA